MLKIFNKKKNDSVSEIEKEQSELKLASDMLNKFLDARARKDATVETWNDCIDAYNSDYFIDEDLPEYKSNQISNYIFSTVETIKPIMVDNDPKIIILPKTQKGMQSVNKIQSLFDSEWKRAKMSQKLIQAITITLQIGTCIWFVPWVAEEENGLGNATPKLINPYNFFPDPSATSRENAEYIIYATYKHVNILKKSYPNKANLLESGTINYPELVSLGGSQDVTGVNNQILVLECYVRDYTTIDCEEEDENGVKYKTKKRKYPNGKVIITAPELGLILEEKENPYTYDDSFPFIIMKDYDIPFEFWGRSEIEQLLSPQEYINELTNQIIDNAKLTANMPWVIDKNAGIGKGQLTNRPGLIIRKTPGTAVERLQPPSMPNYIRETVEILKRDIEVISGIHDVTQGRKPGSISAASAIIALQEAAQARIRLKVKMMEYALMELGHMWYNRIKQYWITNRQVRTFDNKNQVNFVDISPEDLQEEIDFVIEAGSTMPTNKNAMLDLMIRLSQTPGEDGLPMVDRATVLAYTNVPDKDKIIERFAEMSGQKKQEADEMAMQQQAQQIASQQMLAEHQAQIQGQNQQQTFGQDMERMAQEAQLQQVANTNTQITDEQLQAVIQVLQSDPQLLQMLYNQQIK